MTLLLALAAVYAALMALRYGRRGILVVAPGRVRSVSTPGGEPRTEPQRAAGASLEALGFHRLGTRVEDGPWRGLALRSLALADGGAVFADAFEEGPRPGEPARVQLLSTFPDGAALLTANHARVRRAGARGEVSGLPGAGLVELLAAHHAALGRLTPRHGPALPATDLAARDAAARAWYRGPGGAELRGRFAVYLVNSLFAVAVLAWCVASLVRARVAP